MTVAKSPYCPGSSSGGAPTCQVARSGDSGSAGAIAADATGAAAPLSRRRPVRVTPDDAALSEGMFSDLFAVAIAPDLGGQARDFGVAVPDSRKARGTCAAAARRPWRRPRRDRGPFAGASASWSPARAGRARGSSCRPGTRPSRPRLPPRRAGSPARSRRRPRRRDRAGRPGAPTPAAGRRAARLRRRGNRRRPRAAPRRSMN